MTGKRVTDRKVHCFLIATAAFGLLVLPAAWGATRDADTKTPTTFYRDVLPVLQKNCQSCHRPAGANLGGMIAPMSLLTYDEVRPWARAIAKSTMSRYMPPWHASTDSHGVFANERTLTDDEIATLVNWARQGAPAGEVANAPPPLPFSDTGWAIGEPDLVVDMPKEFLVEDDVEDLYINFTTELPLDGDQWVQAIEFRPGSEAVHHIIGYAVAPGESFGAGERGMIGGIAPGNDPETFPDGYGVLLEARSNFVFAMHYHKEKGAGTAITDRSTVAFKFYTGNTPPRPVHIEAIQNGQFEIPPGHANWRVGAARTFDQPIDVLYLMPHLHLRGKAAKYTAFYPDGTSEVLLDVPAYDFNWQTSYEFKEPRRLPKGTRLEVLLAYDNTEGRAREANFNSRRAIRFGGPTTDEMDLGWLSFSYADLEKATSGP